MFAYFNYVILPRWVVRTPVMGPHIPSSVCRFFSWSAISEIHILSMSMKMPLIFVYLVRLYIVLYLLLVILNLLYFLEFIHDLLIVYYVDLLWRCCRLRLILSVINILCRCGLTRSWSSFIQYLRDVWLSVKVIIYVAWVNFFNDNRAVDIKLLFHNR